jgi:hypothetical protein
MPIGTGIVVPAQVTIQAKYSEGAAAWLAQQIKIVPTNPDGSIYDCTAVTAATIKVTNQPNGFAPAQVQTTATPTLVAHDATGVTISLSAANQATLAPMGAQNALCSITITDGTTTVVAGAGNYLLSLVG